MADFAMWGAEQSGSRQFDQDQQVAALRFAQAGQAGASARHLDAETRKLDADRAAQQRLGQLLAEPGEGRTQLEQLEGYAERAFAAGLPAEGLKIADQASKMRLREAQQGQAVTSQAKTDMESQLEQIRYATGLYGGVQDQESFDRANATFTMATGEVSPFAGLEFSPELIQQLRASAMTEEQRIRLAISEAEAESKAGLRESAIDFRNFRRGVLERQTQVAEERERRLQKAGGRVGDKPVGSPTKTETDAAAALVRKEFPNLEAADRSVAASTVASRAKALRKANTALDMSTALERALDEVRGEFTTAAKWGGLQKETRFRAQGPKPVSTTPVALPKSAAEMVKGQHYQTPRGVVRWDGQRGIPVTAPETPAEEDEDDDEE